MRTLVIVFFTMLLAGSLAAQEAISLDALLDTALRQNRDLQQLKLDVEKARRQNRSFQGLGSANMQYTYGQVDGPTRGYNLQVLQPLGNPLGGLANRELRKEQIQNRQLNYELNRAWLQQQVYSTYVAWLHGHRIHQIRGSVKKVYQRALRVAQRQEEEGEISLIEVGFARGRLTEAVQAENAALQMMLNQRQMLEVLSQQSLRERRPGAAPPFPARGATDTGDASLYEAFYESALEVAEQNRRRQNAALFPSFSVGYFNQRLEVVPNLQGVVLGAQVPLFDVSVHQQRQIARIEVDQRRMELEQQSRQRQSQLEILQEQKDHILDELENIQKGDSDTEKNLETARRRYELGEITLLELSQNVSALAAAEINERQMLIRLHNLQAQIDYWNSQK